MNDVEVIDSAKGNDRVGGTWSSPTNRIFAILLLVNLVATMAVFMNGPAGA